MSVRPYVGSSFRGSFASPRKETSFIPGWRLRSLQPRSSASIIGRTRKRRHCRLVFFPLSTPFSSRINLSSLYSSCCILFFPHPHFATQRHSLQIAISPTGIFLFPETLNPRIKCILLWIFYIRFLNRILFNIQRKIWEIRAMNRCRI